MNPSKIIYIFKKHIKRKTAVFIDTATILYSQKDLKWKIDYKKLKPFFEKIADVSGFYYYTSKVEGVKKQTKFLKTY